MSTLNGRILKYKLRKKFNKYEVKRALIYVMEKQAAEKAPGEKNGDLHSEFYNTGRIGRRNALPDILGYNCTTTTTADLPARLSALSTKDTQAASTSGMVNSSKGFDRNEPSTSQSCTMSSENCSTQQQDEDMNTT